MIPRLVFGPRSRRRLYAVRRLKVVEGALARGSLLGVYQARSGEAAIRAARRDFSAHSDEVLAAVDQVASLLAIGGEAVFYPAVVHAPDNTFRRVLLTHTPPDQAFRGLRVRGDSPAGGTLHFAAEDDVE
jgi:hypothetical protein